MRDTLPVLTQVVPMQPTLVRAPFLRDGWVYEEKADGWWMLAYKDGTGVRLVSRNGVDHTGRFADIAGAIGKLSARTLVLDGEVAMYDEQLHSPFEWLREPGPTAVATPPLLMVFDVAKDDTSPYDGGATRRWLKVKQRGWTDTEDRWRRALFEPRD